MPMSVVYATVNGRMVQENRGGTITKYVADTLGSVIQTRNASGVQTSSTTYWPYGEVRTSTGTNPSPWGFVGTLGYFRDALSRLYIRARYYIASIGRWNTVDPLWPNESPYGYAKVSPQQLSDPSGAQASNFKRFCSFCIKQIVFSWWNTSVHHCNHGYTHCMACCVLTLLTGDRECAISNQEFENWIRSRGPKVDAGRMDACKVGSKIVEEGYPSTFPPGSRPTYPVTSNHSACSAGCSNKFPDPPPSSASPDCQKAKKDFPGTWKLPPVPECDPSYFYPLTC